MREGACVRVSALVQSDHMKVARLSSKHAKRMILYLQSSVDRSTLYPPLSLTSVRSLITSICSSNLVKRILVLTLLVRLYNKTVTINVL